MFNEKYKSKCLGQLAGQYSQYRFSTDNQSLSDADSQQIQLRLLQYRQYLG